VFRRRISAAAGRGAASLIDKKTLKKRISNNECRILKECILSILLKGLSKAKLLICCTSLTPET
jgi:hypothetical protein